MLKIIAVSIRNCSGACVPAQHQAGFGSGVFKTGKALLKA
jgi:hypothetical protein